jgi:hypothetical protein
MQTRQQGVKRVTITRKGLTMSSKSRFLGILSVLLVALPAMTVSASSAPARHMTSAVKTHASQGPVTVVEGATATLRSTDAGVVVTIRTRQLEVGHAHTLWVVTINRPDLCETSPCTANDIVNRTDIVEANVVYGGGRVVRGQTTVFMAFVPVGEVAGGWYDNAFTDPRGADIHLVINDHGPIIPGLALEMTRTYRAGCTDASIPPAFPPTAFADGTPGPNQCRLMQFATFEQ